MKLWKTKQHYLLYFVFIVIRPDLSEVCLRLPAHDCNQSVISEGCLVAAFLLILSFLTGTNEKVNFSTSQSGRQPVSYSAHPTGPATRQLISHRWRRWLQAVQPTNKWVTQKVVQLIVQLFSCSTKARWPIKESGFNQSATCERNQWLSGSSWGHQWSTPAVHTKSIWSDVKEAQSNYSERAQPTRQSFSATCQGNKSVSTGKYWE